MLRSWDFETVYEWRAEGKRQPVRIVRVAAGWPEGTAPSGKHFECIFEVDVLAPDGTVMHTGALAKSIDLYKLDG